MAGLTGCPACAGVGWRTLPQGDDMEYAPCPCCQHHYWPYGFPGEGVKRGGRWIWLIEPSKPGEAARYVGHPSVNPDRTETP